MRGYNAFHAPLYHLNGLALCERLRLMLLAPRRTHAAAVAVAVVDSGMRRDRWRMRGLRFTRMRDIGRTDIERRHQFLKELHLHETIGHQE
jgi:hypothetical protein